MEVKSVETNSSENHPTPPSVAKLAGKFNDQSTTVNKEVPLPRPIRRKPPCSLPLHVNKGEPGHNGEEKATGNASHQQKIKVKSSPLIEKLQANLALGALLPGGPPKSPKSPGLKTMPSPFNSPPSTPNSPNVHSRSSESEETPVSFEQPPEGPPLRSYVKVRTRGSVKRRPPSRSFRKSQTDMGDEDSGSISVPKQNGGKSEEGDEVREKSPESSDQTGRENSPEPSDEKLSGSKPSMPENVEEKGIDGTKEALEGEANKESTEKGTEMDTANAEMAAEDMDKQKKEESQAVCQEPATSMETAGGQESTGTAQEPCTEQSKSDNEDKSSQDAGN